MLKHSSSLHSFNGEKKGVPGQYESLNLEWELTQVGQIVKCNTASIRSLGYSQNELINLSKSNEFLALIHADDRPQFLTALQATKNTTSNFNLLRMKHKKGKWRHIAYNTKISMQNKNVHFSGLDITPLLKDISFMLNEVRNLIQQLLAVVEACQTDFEENSYRKWMDIGELILKNLLDLLKTPIHSYSLPNLSEHHPKRQRSADSIYSERGSKRVNSQNVFPEVKNCLQNAEKTYQDSSDIQAVLGIKDGNISIANESLKSILGYSIEEWGKIQKSGPQGILSLIHENDRELITKNLQPLQLGIPCFAVARVRHFDSHKGYVCLGGYANPNTSLGIIYVSAKDLTPYLTDTRQLIHEARNAAQLIQASFMEVKEVLESKTKVVQAKQKEIISIAEQAKVCIWNFLRVLQRQTTVEFLAIKPVATNLTECISKVVNLFRIEMEKKGLALEISLSKDAFYMVDRLQFEGILINIMTNALKYTLTGKITVSLNIENGQNMSESRLKVTVSDTGIGISKEDLSHMFEPYYRTQRAKACNTGTGLGLPIVKQIVEKMGGTFSLESKEGRGTTVTLVLSAQKATVASLKNQQLLDVLQMDFGYPSPSNSQFNTPEDSSRELGPIEIRQEEKISSENELKGLKVLIVDDCEINTKIYEKMLVKLGCVCARVLSGRLAIEQLISNNKANSPSFDFIFMDISMPELDGLETTKRIKAAKLAERSIIIGISGNVDQDAEQRALESGMVDYIPKPATEKRIEATIRKNLPSLYKMKVNKQKIKPNTAKSMSQDFSTVGLFASTSAPHIQMHLNRKTSSGAETAESKANLKSQHVESNAHRESYLSSSSSSSSSFSRGVSPVAMALQRKLLLLAATSSSFSSSSSSEVGSISSSQLQRALELSPATSICLMSGTTPAI